MKLIGLLIVCCCLFSLAFGHSVAGTKPPFVRSRYSIRWRKTTTTKPETTSIRGIELATSTDHPKVATSTASPDYDYYGNNDAENMVPK